MDSSCKGNSRFNNLFIIWIVFIEIICTLIVNFLTQGINISGSMIINMHFIWIECAMTSSNKNMINTLINSTWINIAFSISNLILINAYTSECQRSPQWTQSISPPYKRFFMSWSYHWWSYYTGWQSTSSFQYCFFS